jgi:hypothetical protein
MTEFNRLHAAIFGVVAGVDVAGLAQAVTRRFHLASADPLRLMPAGRCANGACDE